VRRAAITPKMRICFIVVLLHAIVWTPTIKQKFVLFYTFILLLLQLCGPLKTGCIFTFGEDSMLSIAEAVIRFGPMRNKTGCVQA